MIAATIVSFASRASGGLAPPWVLWPLLGACAGVYLFYRGFGLLQRKRLIMNTPASKIRSAAMGLVEVSGLAAGPYTLTAPVTGVPSFYYRTMAWQWKRQGKSNQWVKVADESLHVPFYVEDNTGKVLIDPQGAEMDIHRDFHDEFSQSLFSSRMEIPANIISFLVRHGVPTDCKIKIEEYCIKPKNALFVLGTLAPNPGLSVSQVPVRSLTADQHAVSFQLPASDRTFSFSAAVGNGLSLGGFVEHTTPPEVISPHTSSKPPLDPAQQAKIVAALTKAGITSPMAWAAAGLDAVPKTAAVAVASSGSAAGAAPAMEQFDLHPPAVLMRGEHDRTFLISWRSQREVLASLNWKSTLMIWGGPALTLLCVYILAAQFGWL